jgi:hypothetical protein
MLDLRIYRTAFVPLLMVVVVVAFSLGTRPKPLTTNLAADAFDGPTAMRSLAALAQAYPRRGPGSPGDGALATHVASVFRANQFTTRTVTFDGDTVAGRATLETVIGSRPGSANSGIVIVAHRDARRAGSQAELSGTAVLLELARVLGGRVTQRPVTLVSTSGGSGGAAGAAELAHELPGPVDAVIVVGDLAGARSRRPYVVPWSNGSSLAPIVLRRTVENSLQAELGRSPGGPSPIDQAVRLAFPLTVGEQGPLLAAGLPAVLVQQSGEVGPRSTDGVPATTTTIQEFGRGVLRALTALDGAPDINGSPTRDIVIGARVLPGWAMTLLVAVLILPALVAAVDMLARARRRREPVAIWLGWIGAAAVPFAIAALFAALLGRIGLLSAAPVGPVTSQQLPIGTGGRTALISVALVFALAWFLRPRIVSRLALPTNAPGSGAAVALALTLCGLSVLAMAFNPFAAALLVLPLNLWLLATSLEPPLPRGAAIALVLIGLFPLAATMGLDAARLSLGPESFAWTGLLLVAGSHVKLGALLLWSIAAGGLVSAVLIVAHRSGRRPAPPEVTVRGPLTYAGPGSLGGTDSALRR